MTDTTHYRYEGPAPLRVTLISQPPETDMPVHLIPGGIYPLPAQNSFVALLARRGWLQEQTGQTEGEPQAEPGGGIQGRMAMPSPDSVLAPDAANAPAESAPPPPTPSPTGKKSSSKTTPTPTEE